MPTFERCPASVNEIANSILVEFDTHRPILDARVKIDFVFAFADKDEKTGEPINNAMTKNGCKALGVCRKISLKDRALGRGDAEIALDGDWWKDASPEERAALLDHELHHIEVKIDNRGPVRDDLGRPVLRLRKHDHEFGWFTIIASRHGQHSQERIQAKSIMDMHGQFYWQDLVK